MMMMMMMMIAAAHECEQLSSAHITRVHGCPKWHPWWLRSSLSNWPLSWIEPTSLPRAFDATHTYSP